MATDAVSPADFEIRTADWDLTADGSAVFREGELATGSCRPWVRLERREVRVVPRQRRIFRFEIHVPADAPVGECRFALMIEGKDPSTLGSGNIRVPLQGRIAVIVYLAVGGAKAVLEVKSMQASTINGRLAPTITVQNTGSAHGRPEGTLEARDASGKALEFSIASSPVLPGSTRTIPLWPNEGADRKMPEFSFPLRLKGKVEWEGGDYAVDTVIRP